MPLKNLGLDDLDALNLPGNQSWTWLKVFPNFDENKPALNLDVQRDFPAMFDRVEITRVNMSVSSFSFNASTERGISPANFLAMVARRSLTWKGSTATLEWWS